LWISYERYVEGAFNDERFIYEFLCDMAPDVYLFIKKIND